MKSKQVAGILALLFGIFGVHRFYLGKRVWGILHMILFFFCMMLTIEEGEPFIMVPAILGFIDAILLFVMPKEEFDDRYNRKYLEGAYGSYSRSTYRRRSLPARQPAPPPAHPERIYKKRGVEHFRQFNYEAAIEEFHTALDYHYEDPITHFNLACCYSRLEETDEALHHLSEAVAFGFKDVKKIHTHASLAFLRATPEFDDFVADGYQKLEREAPPEPPAVEVAPPVTPAEKEQQEDLLDQIVRLGELRDKGILTEEEFSLQKQKLLKLNS